jgi:hypothetical protein
VRREAVNAAGAFSERVPIGTDYHLAKKLIAAGKTIHFVPVAVESQFEEGVLARTAQQSRWIRNIVVHGPRFGDRRELKGILRTMVIGTSLLAWPFTWRRTRLAGVAAWLIPVAWMTRERVRQQERLATEHHLKPLGGLRLRAALYSLADLIAWARPVWDLVRPGSRFRW